MTHSQRAVDLVREFEGCRLTAYRDGGGILTIGYGHTAGVTENQVCTEEQAENWLNADLAASDEVINRHVNVKLNQNQFDALVDFVYNVGSNNFAQSSLLRFLNMGQNILASREFGRWIHDEHHNIERGLVRRRTAEMDLFLA